MADNGCRILRCLLAVSLGMLLLPGCGSRDQDVTKDPAFGNFTSIVGTWRTKIPVKLVERNETLYLVSEDTPMSASHEIAKEPAGIRLRIEHLMFRKTIETDLLWVTGSLVDGQYAGRIIQFDGNFFPREMMLHYKLHHDNNAATPKPSWTVATDKLEK